MGIKYEVKCNKVPSLSTHSAVEAEELRASLDKVCPGPHEVDAVVTETNDDRLAAAEEADERAWDRRVDSEMDLAREDEMADYYVNVGRTPEDEGA